MIEVRVPATTANMGPGFDVIGMALNLHNTFTFSMDGGEVDRDSMIYRSAEVVFRRAKRPMDGFVYAVEAEVPMARGLGSSATCIVGGMAGANALLGSPFSRDEILEMASDFEGHPDNVAPALLGGCVVSAPGPDGVFYRKLKRASDFTPIVAIPDFDLSTEKARAALPEALAYGDCVYNIGNMAFLVYGLETGDFEALLRGAGDRIHQPYRGPLIQGYDAMATIEETKKGKMLISGAGPTLLFLTAATEDAEAIQSAWERIAAPLDAHWEIRTLAVDDAGAVVRKI